MTRQEIFAHIEKAFPDKGLVMDEMTPEQFLIVPKEQLLEVMTFLREDPELDFDCLMCLTGVDALEETLQVVYNLFSMSKGHKFDVRCVIAKEDPVVPTVSGVWATAEWHEREAFDLVGMTFENHPDHRRILCPDDWEGHPLRKDYVPQEKWHDIPLTSIVPDNGREGA